MTAIVLTVDIDAPVEEVFAFVGDYRNALQYMAHFRSFEPATPNSMGLGARVLARGQLHGIPIAAELEIVGFDKNRRLESVSRKGLRSSSQWLFEPKGSGTKVTFAAEFEIPRLPLARLLRKVIGEEIKSSTQRTLQNLKRVMEQRTKPKPEKDGSSKDGEQ